MLFKIFQLLESIFITDKRLCLIKGKWPNSLFFLIFSSVIGLFNFLINLTVTATKRPDWSDLSKYAYFITSTIPTISFPMFE